MRSFGIKVNRYSNLVPHSLLHCVRGALDGTGIVKAHKQSPLVGYPNLEPTFLRRSKAAPMDGPRAAPRFPLGQVVVKDAILVAVAAPAEFVEIDEIARLTCFLMSDAARSINGAELKIEGGWCAQ